MIYIVIKCESHKTVFKLVIIHCYIQTLIQFEKNLYLSLYSFMDIEGRTKMIVCVELMRRFC